MCLSNMYGNSPEYVALRLLLSQIQLAEIVFNDPKRIIPLDKITCNRDYSYSDYFLFDVFTCLIEFAGRIGFLLEQNKNNTTWRYRSSVKRADRLYMKTYSKIRKYIMTRKN